MRAQEATWEQGVADDGTLMIFTPCPSEHHKAFYDPATNAEAWGIEEDLKKFEDLRYNKPLANALGVIVVSGGFMYYRVIE
jgi:hypothetical protein